MDELRVNHYTKPAAGSRPNIKVFIYHRIIRGNNGAFPADRFAIDVKTFESHLRFFERFGLTPITFEDYRLAAEGELTLPRKPVIITFDDGYLDTYELAYPLLREYGMTAVVFVLGEEQITSNIWDAGPGHPPVPLMKKGHILEMHQAGIEIGSHSLTHAPLTELPREKAWEEISRSRILLEILLNSEVRTFSYPYGLLNDEVREMVRDAGYTTACGVYTGPAQFGNDIYNIRRLTPMGGRMAIGVGIQSLTPYEWYAAARFGISRLLRSRNGIHGTNAVTGRGNR